MIIHRAQSLLRTIVKFQNKYIITFVFLPSFSLASLALYFVNFLDFKNKSNCIDAILTDILTLPNLLSPDATQIAYFVPLVE